MSLLVRIILCGAGQSKMRSTSGPYDPNVLGYICATLLYTKETTKKS